MTHSSTPQWQPITRLPLIAGMIDGMLQDAQEHYATLQEARPRPHVLDDATVGRVIAVFTEQRDDLWLYEEQLRRWAAGTLAPTQRREVERLGGQLKRLHTVIAEILALAEELQQGTIERVLAMDDGALGLDVLLGRRRP